MKKNNLVFLEHILQSITLIEDYVEGVTKENFVLSIKIQDCVFRRLEIIGEAAKNVSSELQTKYKDVPWSEMAKTRDKLIHGYFGIDLEITWDVIEHDLPKLKKQILDILKKEKF
ncbi:DUF86 domain-containing protein [Candidatus Woesearchaeota archaeon]|nr:DUF86 domain-containing protein [Candidatus Woesearchaeota archaeon]